MEFDALYCTDTGLDTCWWNLQMGSGTEKNGTLVSINPASGVTRDSSSGLKMGILDSQCSID